MAQTLRSRNRVRNCILAILLTVCVAAPATADGDAPFESWCSLLQVVGTGDGTGPAPEELPSELELRQARYEVDVLGNLAVGTLTVEFQNTTAETLRVKYLSRNPAGFQVESTQAQPGEVDQDAWVDLQAPKSKKEGSRQGRQGAARKTAAPAASPTQLTVPPMATVTVQKKFRRTIPFTGDRFDLLLPATGGECTAMAPYWPEEGAPSGMLGARVRIHHDEQPSLVESPSHEVLVSFEDGHSLVELLADPNGDRPLEIGFSLGQSDEPVLTAFVAPAVNDEREVMIVLAPALETPEESVRPKEALFVLDTSGSMQGEKLVEAAKALDACLDKVGEDDLFNIARFNQEFALLHAEPVEATPGKVEAARAWLAAQRAGGGTKLFPALETVLDLPHDDELHRLVVVLSDGQLGDAKQVESLIEERLGDARLFLVGIGEDANETGIMRLAQLGRGTAVFATTADQLESAVTDLFSGIAAPVAWDLELHWGDAEVISMQPTRVPDLYAGRPVTITARVRGELPADLLVEASTMDGVRVFTTALPAGGAREFGLIESKSE